MNFRLTILTVVIFFSSFAFVIKSEKRSSIVVEFEDIELDLRSNFDNALDRLDSLQNTFSANQEKEFKPYTDYFYGFISFRNGNYDNSLSLMDGSLHQFMYSQDGEWAAKCLIIISTIAEYNLLIPEAINGFQIAFDVCELPRTSAVAHLGIIRNRKRIHLDWKNDVDDVISELSSTSDMDLNLYAKLIPYWFFSDIPHPETNLLSLASKFNDIGRKDHQSDVFKCLALHYEKNSDYLKVVEYSTRCIAILNTDHIPNQILLSSTLFLRAKAYLNLNEPSNATEDFENAIGIYEKIDQPGSLYSLYKYLSTYYESIGEFEKANNHLRKSLIYQNRHANSRIARSVAMSEIFLNLQKIEDELLTYKRISLRNTIVISLFLFLFFTFILVKLRRKHIQIQKKSDSVEDTNAKLLVETGELLDKVGKSNVKQEILKNQNDIEYKVDRFLKHNVELSSYLKDHYAEAILCFSKNLPTLSDTEKRYAVLIALGVPYKVISQLLSVQPTTVSQYRNRIRKKIGICNKDVDLEEYLKSYLSF